MKICFATQNINKTTEVNRLLADRFDVINLLELNFLEDIPETETTLEGNSRLKARFSFEKFGMPSFADDSGLEVDALDGSPGVFSARYAGGERSDISNMRKLLQNLEGKTNRNAQFKTVITLMWAQGEKQFTGIIKGKIVHEMKGDFGFGYDPIFVPDGYDCTFAEMSREQKNNISHRAIAVKKLVEFLKNSEIDKG